MPEHHDSSSVGHAFPWMNFLAALAVFCLGHWLGTQVLHGLHGWLPGLEHHPLLLGLVSAGLLLGFYGMLRHEHHVEPRSKGVRRFWQFLLALVVLVSAFCAASGLEMWITGTFPKLEHHPLVFAAGCLAGLAVLEPLYHRLQMKVEHPRDVRPLLHLRKQNAEPVSALIMFISPPTAGVTLELAADAAAAGHHAKLTFPKDGKTAQLKGAGHAADDVKLADGTGFWNWVPLVRAVKDHEGLTQVVLLGSQSERGSHRHLESCERFLSAYLPEGCRIRSHEQPLDFTDFNLLVSVLRELILKDLKAIPKSRIAIDVTGGQTTASISGAATTMTLDCVFQYVNTNEPKNVLTYDVIPEGGTHFH